MHPLFTTVATVTSKWIVHVYVTCAFDTVSINCKYRFRPNDVVLQRYLDEFKGRQANVWYRLYYTGPVSSIRLHALHRHASVSVVCDWHNGRDRDTFVIDVYASKPIRV